MTQKTNTIPAAVAPAGSWRYWRGLGGWNYYFLLKFGLLWYGYLNFNALANLAFMAYLLLPIPNIRLHRLRHWIGLPIAIGLFYHDTWLPGLNSILSQGGQLASFSGDYLLELLQRFINWKMVGAAFILWVAYLFFSLWLRITTLTVIMLVWLNLGAVSGPVGGLSPVVERTTAVPAPGVKNEHQDEGEAGAPATSQNLRAYLNAFYEREQGRQTAFPSTLATDAQPFDILLLNICSLSWSDLEMSGLDDHPLWRHFDVMFTNFNSATSYSGPAGIRLLRASCGQSPQKDLYQPVDPRCYLFDNLAQLGFDSRLMMDHTGNFGNYLVDLRRHGNLEAALMPQQGIGHQLVAFDGEPILNDQQLLRRWLEQRQSDTEPRSATFFNLIPLHDGNRWVGERRPASFQSRAELLLEQLDAFLEELEQSGRQVMVLFVPEHGAALGGDRIQLAGLRDIPNPRVTRVPVGIKLIGMQRPYQGPRIEVSEPTSYLAISELLARMVDGRAFGEEGVDWQALLRDLPRTALVSDTENAVVIEYQGNDYVSLSGGDWMPYPR
ncbi:cellulose biosynthesis protein BcsG [Zobellella sp. DQSA1]|uniref:cellulose biosynthesis protein BcsG n=1 Tax=Zobellella sp. DQSA1 TaxID=3342386 RepID=UPI0035BEC088